MVQDAHELIDEISTVIGLDAYVMYPDSKRLIPDVVIWGFASAFLLEFVKALVDLKGLGENLRKRAEFFLQSWKAKIGFEAIVSADDVNEVNRELIAALPQDIGVDELDKGRVALRDALVGLGLKVAVAERHAQKIAELIKQAKNVNL